MIEAHEIIPHLLTACPGFQPDWNEHLDWWGDDEQRGLYLDVGAFAQYLVDAYMNGNVECFSAAFAVIEQLIVDGTDDVQGLAIVGILEGIQNIASHQPFGHVVFTPWLGPHSRAAWLELVDFWEGKQSLADTTRAERGSTPSGT